jgi:hypothetical protein
MKQHEAVIKVMEENGGFSTLNYLYQKALLIKDCAWKTKTPYASIRRIVQDDRFFFKIKPGLWALKSKKAEVLSRLKLDIKDKSTDRDFSHSYYQGILVELGNMKSLQTFVSSQDQNKFYLNKKLHDMITLPKIYPFTYDHLLRKAQTVDVTWFNERKFPHSFYEVEHTTDINNSLLKFNELQDFFARFIIVADKRREEEFKSKLSQSAFLNICKRVEFLNYDKLSSIYEKTSELYLLSKETNSL